MLISKLWLGSLKYWSSCGGFCLLTSVRWLLNLIFSSIYDFPMYWIRQILQFIAYINSLLLQFMSLTIWYVFCVTLPLKDCVCRIYLHHKFSDFEKQLVKNPIIFLLNCLCSFLSTIFLHSRRSERFLFLLKAKISSSWNTSLNSWFIWSKL